ncbi:hypothetical protein ACHAW6_004250 [Cyclotella cf. meneghiniana]
MEENIHKQQLVGKKVQDIFIKTYDVRNKYIMVLVDIDSNAILVEPMKSQKDEELIRAFDVLVGQLQREGIQRKKHFLDSEISTNMKAHINKKYKFLLELIQSRCIAKTQLNLQYSTSKLIS